MAIKPYTQVPCVEQASCVVFKWEGLIGDETGNPICLPAFADKTVQVKGDFGTGANVLIEGSNDVIGTPIWATLADPQGNALSITTAKIETVLENPYWIRPNVSGGGAGANLTITICGKR